MNGVVYMIVPFESNMTRRGDRTPQLAAYLSRKGRDVVFVTTDFYHAEKTHFEDEYIREKTDEAPYDQIVWHNPGYRRNLSPVRVISDQMFSLKAFFYLMRKLKKGDVLFLQSRPPELVLWCTLAGRLKQTSVLLDVPDIWPDSFPDIPVVKQLFWVYCAIHYRLSVPMVNRFTHVSYVCRDWIRRYNRKAEMTFIPLGFDPERWGSCQPIGRIDGEIIKIVYVGNISQVIDLHPFLESIKGREDIRFTIVGGGDRLEEIRRFVSENDMDNVTFEGFVGKEEVVGIMKEHHVSLIPVTGRTITLPNKLYDSVASFRPVLSLGDNDISVFVERHGIGWTAPYDPKEISSVLDGMDPEEIVSRSHGISRIRERYSRDALHERFSMIFDELTERSER